METRKTWPTPPISNENTQKSEPISTISSEAHKCEPIATMSTEIHTIWASCDYFNWNALGLSKWQIFHLKHIIWAKCNYFNWYMHKLSQLQRFQLKHTLFELITTLSSKTCTSWVKVFSRKVHIVWTDCNYFTKMCIVLTESKYFNWNGLKYACDVRTKLSELKLFQSELDRVDWIELFKIKHA